MPDNGYYNYTGSLFNIFFWVYGYFALSDNLNIDHHFMDQ